MPEYLAPGVYIEERPGQRSIEGVSTSTVGFVGMTQRGPIMGPPVLVTSLGEFQRAFGGYLPLATDASLGVHGQLPLAVKQFFDNGGKRAFVARAYKWRDATKPEEDFRQLTLATGVAARLRSTAPKDADHMFVTTYRGFDPATSLLVRDTKGGPTQAITAIDPSSNKATVAKLAEDYRADTAFVQMTAITTGGSAKLIAREPGVWGEHVRVQVRPAPTAAVATTAAIPKAATSIPVSSAATFYRGCVVQISEVGGAAGAEQIQNVRYATVASIVGSVLNLVKPATDLPAYGATKTSVSLVEVDVLVSWDTTVERFRGSWRFIKAPLSSWTDAEIREFNENHCVWVALETHSTLLRVAKDATGDFELGSALFSAPDPLNSHPTTPDGSAAALVPVKGDAGVVDPTPGFPEYVGNPAAGPGARSGLAALSDEESISLVAIPGITSATVQEQLITHAELARFRFAVLDAPSNADIAGVRSHRGQFDSEYAALYYPWLEIAHPLTGELIDVPPSGSVIGVYARTDVERGVFKAPANEVARNATDLVTRVTTGEQEVLNPEGINVIRDFRRNNRGIRVWGARTISSDPEWKYVNVRRLFIFIEHSIDQGTQWVVFEPNNPELWGRVKRTIETFLEGQWRSGALSGTKKEEAFYVKCDRSTMSLDDIANGRLVVEIGIAPTRPAEFVIFRIGQFTADATSN